MSDTNLVYALNNLVTGPGSLGIGTVTNESKVRFVITNADVSNLIRIRARINNQPTWTTLADLSGSINEVVDVFTWDQIEAIVLVYSSLSDRILVNASSYDSSIFTIETPDGELSDISNVIFTSSDDSVIITGDPDAGTIDFISVGGGGGTPDYVATFNDTSDWSGPSSGFYSQSIPLSTHHKTNPTVDLFETVSGNNEQVMADISVDGSYVVTIKVPQTPDLRFAGKIIIS